MTKKEIHIRSLLRKKGWQYDPRLKMYNKYKWKKVEPKKKQTYCHVILRVDAEKETIRATIFLDTLINSVDELEKYYIVYNRVKDETREVGLKLL